MPAGDDRRPRRRHQGTRRPGRRLPRVDRVVGGPAARLRPPRHARPGPGRRRRRAGVLGRAARGVPQTREQRCWFHKIANVLGRAAQVRPPRREEGPGRDLERRGPRPRPPRRAAFKLAYGAKFGKAVAKITDDLDELLAFYDYPAEHWVHLRTTNPIESTFATVRHRTKVTKGPGSKAAGLAMAFKLIEAAQARWRAVNAPHLVALVRAGARSTTASSSNDPTNTTNPKPPKRSSSTGLDYCSRTIWRTASEAAAVRVDAAILILVMSAVRPAGRGARSAALISKESNAAISSGGALRRSAAACPSGIGGSEVGSFENRFNGLELIRVSDTEAGQCQHERTPR